jgi:hypothetical protein
MLQPESQRFCRNTKTQNEIIDDHIDTIAELEKTEPMMYFSSEAGLVCLAAFVALPLPNSLSFAAAFFASTGCFSSLSPVNLSELIGGGEAILSRHGTLGHQLSAAAALRIVCLLER